MNQLLQAMWTGMRNTCPSCRQGRIFRGLWQENRRCPVCNAAFERNNEGDFLGAMVTAYSIISVLVIIGVFLVSWLTDLAWDQQVILWSIFAALVMGLGYRNLKGLWIGILHVMLGGLPRD